MQDGSLGNSSAADNITIRLLLWMDCSSRFGLVSLGDSSAALGSGDPGESVCPSYGWAV